MVDLPDLELPQVSINGTSVEELVRQQSAVILGLARVIRSMSQCRPHGRDYQYRPAEYPKARDAWEARIKLVVGLQDELTAHAREIQRTEG